VLKTEFASRCTRQRMGSGLSKVQNATWVQTRRELDRVVELEQARQQFMQQVLSRCLLLTILNINLFLYSDCNAARSAAEAAGTFA
jgi:hypothetical protein